MKTHIGANFAARSLLRNKIQTSNQEGFEKNRTQSVVVVAVAAEGQTTTSSIVCPLSKLGCETVDLEKVRLLMKILWVSWNQ